MKKFVFILLVSFTFLVGCKKEEIKKDIVDDDSIAPTVPANMVASSVASNSVVITWKASTDNVEVTGYEVFINGTKTTVVTSTYYIARNLTASTKYTFSVKAKDLAGNLSDASSSLDFTTTTADMAELTDKNASDATKALWNYLKSNYATSMLTGVATGEDDGAHNNIKNSTGQMAAIYSKDMNSWYRNRSEPIWNQVWNNYINGAKTAYARRQIITIHWHWQAVYSKVSETAAYTRDAWGKDANGNVQMMTDAQWNDIVTPGTSLYNIMIEDIDYHVNNYLKKLVDDKGEPIPILFRPLHEIDGGWFWWTCKSDPTKTVRLYKILQDRIMNYHQMHNLIWVWNNGVLNANGAWPPYGANEISVRRPYYVGDEYCDLIGIDLYNFDPVNRGKYHTFNITYRNVWDLMKAITPNKMIALCEAEGFPDPQKCFTDPTYAPWLYCLPWYTQNYWDEATNKNIDLISWNKSVFKSDFVKNAPF